MRVLDTIEGAPRRGRVVAPARRGRCWSSCATSDRRGARGDGRRPATISNASTACSARRKRSARRSRAAAGSPARAFSAPVIKAAGIATGTSRTVRRLRRKDASTELVAVATQRGGAHDEAYYVVRRRRRRRCRRRRRTPRRRCARTAAQLTPVNVVRSAGARGTRPGPPCGRCDPGRTRRRCTPARTSSRRAATPGSRRSTTSSSPAISCTSTGGRSSSARVIVLKRRR